MTAKGDVFITGMAPTGPAKASGQVKLRTDKPVKARFWSWLEPFSARKSFLFYVVPSTLASGYLLPMSPLHDLIPPRNPEQLAVCEQLGLWGN